MARVKSPSSTEIQKISAEVIACERCPRLRRYCGKIAREKKKQFETSVYWGKPVPSFGDPRARLMIVGLAPAAHGANRTGRMFTGDNSGLWLYRALARAGFANEVGLHQEPNVGNREDGLELRDAIITAVARCAPPENKPTPKEIENCSEYLIRELDALKELRVFLVLGQIALKGLWSVLPEEWKPVVQGRSARPAPVPKFSHGARVQLRNGMWIVCSYHPSQQNTFTRKLTEPMFDSIFSDIQKLLP